MSVAKVVELTGKSNKSFDDALKQVAQRAAKTLNNVKCIDIINQTVDVNDQGQITDYQVNCKVIFVLNE